MNELELRKQINAVVDARELAVEVTSRRIEAYQKWEEEHSQLLLNEKDAKSACQEAETKLREMTIESYVETGDKSPLPGIGIRVMTRLNYEIQKAMEWAMEHKLALELDSSTFEKIAKTSNLPFVTITEEPQATIAPELIKEAIDG